jgi:hypothetical protein
VANTQSTNLIRYTIDLHSLSRLAEIRREGRPLHGGQWRATTIEKDQRVVPSSSLEKGFCQAENAVGAPMSMFQPRHYTTRFRKSERLRYRIPRLVWLFVLRASGARRSPA